MTSEQLEHIFEEFYKADESRHDFENSGLGMTICKRIVEKHGGTIWAESEGANKGSTFFVTLPKTKDKKLNQMVSSKHDNVPSFRKITKKIDQIIDEKL
jgi:signal transduction histidine kinase